jgi:gamma-glutamyltranspeptidase/glutathione hydrolase
LKRRRLPALGLVAMLAACAASPAPVPLPEVASGLIAQRPQSAAHFMVSAAHPLAVQAGVQLLQRGGSAVDAGSAMQMVLTSVEPQASGFG